MQTNIQDISQTKKKISISVPKEKIPGYLKRAYQKVGQKAKIKGFRPGKVPDKILDQHYASEIDYESVNFLINDSYQAVLKEHDFFPVDEPKFDVTPINRDADYAYSVEIEIKPKFELKNYKGISIKKQHHVVTDEEVQEELGHLQERMTQLVPAEDGGSLVEGFVGGIDFVGKVDGVAFEGGTAKDFQLDPARKQMLPDFDKGVLGMKLNETRVIDVAFPADYFTKELAGKTASFSVTLQKLYKKSVPTIDDDFAKDLEKENLEQLKNEVRDMLLKHKDDDSRRDYAEQAKKALLKAHTFEVPQSIVEKEVAQGKREKAEVEDHLRVEFILEAVARAEKLQVLPVELERRIAAMAQMYRQPVAEIRKFYAQNNLIPHLVSQVLVDKALDYIIDNAIMS
jgi:trigger factor